MQVTQEMVGKRILFRRKPVSFYVEATVLELTPGGRVKIRYAGGGADRWFDNDGYEVDVVEVLT